MLEAASAAAGGAAGGDEAAEAASGAAFAYSAFFLPFWGIFGETLDYEATEMAGEPLGLLLWLYFLLSQVVLLNLLIAVMSDTWGSVKEHADEEWKFLSVASIDEFFGLHHVPPPFNCVQLSRDLLPHLLAGRDLPRHDAGGAAPLLSREDIKKRAKTAQLKVLAKERHDAEQTAEAQLEVLRRMQRETVDRLDKLSGAADRTSSELRSLREAAALHPVRRASAAPRFGTIAETPNTPRRSVSTDHFPTAG